MDDGEVIMREFHEVANLFPLLQGDEFDDFCQDILENGLLEPIWLHPNGKIIDGRNRYNACQKVGVAPRYKTWDGQGSLVSFVVSLNLHRRHLTSGQKAALAVELEPFFAAEAKERQVATQLQGKSKDGEPVFGEGKNSLTEKGQARDQAAAAVGANGRYVSDAKRLKREAPQVFEQVKSGEISIPEAKKIVAQPERAYNYKRDERASRPVDIYTPQGYDGCQTPAYALDPLISRLDPGWTIWEPAAGELSLVEALYDGGFESEQVIASDIQTGQNFFEYEPVHWHCLITNPPFSIKFQWLERCYQLGKPFALLVPVEMLGTKTAQQLLQQYGFEMMLLDKRVDFKMPRKGWNSSAQFPVFWLCWRLLPERIMFGELAKNGR